MGIHDVKDQIVSVARDKCLFQHAGAKAFGFDFQGCPIEVHVDYQMRRVKGTGVFARVPVLNIYGVLKDGRLHLINDKVSAIQGVTE